MEGKKCLLHRENPSLAFMALLLKWKCCPDLLKLPLQQRSHLSLLQRSLFAAHSCFCFIILLCGFEAAWPCFCLEDANCLFSGETDAEECTIDWRPTRQMWGEFSLEISAIRLQCKIIKCASSHPLDREYTENWPANEATCQLDKSMNRIWSYVQANLMEIKYSSNVIKSNGIIEKWSVFCLQIISSFKDLSGEIVLAVCLMMRESQVSATRLIPSSTQITSSHTVSRNNKYHTWNFWSRPISRGRMEVHSCGFDNVLQKEGPVPWKYVKIYFFWGEKKSVTVGFNQFQQVSPRTSHSRFAI